MDHIARTLGQTRFNNLFDGVVQSDDSPSTGTPRREVHDVSSSDDDATVTEEPAGHARQAGTSNTSSPGRKRRKKNKGLQESPHKKWQVPMSMPKPTRIHPQDPDPSYNFTTSSSSTRQSTNRGKQTGAYATGGLKSSYGYVDNGFDNPKPGLSNPSTLSWESNLTRKASEQLPSFMRGNVHAGISSRHTATSSALPVPDKENRDNASRNSYQSSSTATTSAGVPRGLRPDKGPINMIGAAAKRRQAQLPRPLPEETRAPPAQVKSIASTSKPSINVESASPTFMALVPTATSTAVATSSKGKARNDVIELDDESDGHDSIQDSDGSGPQVQTSKASGRARMNSGPSSSASRAIPNGNTQAKKKIFDEPTKQQGTTIHQNPPSHKANTSFSDDSFSLVTEKPGKMVNRMESKKSSSTSTIDVKAKAKSKKDVFYLPLQSIITENGTYGPAEKVLNLVLNTNTKGNDFWIVLQGRCKSQAKETRQTGTIPSLRDMVISSDQIGRIIIPGDRGYGTTFMSIEIETDANISESHDPKSSFYFFQIRTRGTPQDLDAEFDAAKAYLKRISQNNRTAFSVDWVTNHDTDALFLAARQRAVEHATEAKEREARGRDSLRQSDIHELMKPRQKHDHQLEDVPGEDAPVVIAPKARPKARPSAGSALPSSFLNNLDVQQSSYRKAASSTTTVSSTEDSSSESGIDITNSRKKTRSCATNETLVSDDSNSRKTANGRSRQSNSPELLSDKAPRSSGQRQTRLAKSNADSKIKTTAASDLDDEVRPDPKLWKGRLEPEEETALVFPREGTGAVTVINSDINRLAPGEFLNDTLIEYGMKRIWQRIRDSDPSYADQIHMFSSFFYKKLSTRDRKTKTEPYKTVRKWTSKIDLFQKKYILVPINEYFHWYLAIIVNPGRILKPPPPPSQKPTPLKRATRSSQEGVQHPNEGDQQPAAPITTSRFFSASQTDAKSSKLGQTSPRHRSNSIQDVFSPHENLPSPELPEDDRSPTASPDAMEVDGETKPEGKALLSTSDSMLEQKGNATILDDRVKGLNLNTTAASASIPDLDDESKHPGVIQNLKNYLISEAKDKDKLPEDATVPLNEADGIFRGMAAAVPQQPNMSDCGLYVLHFTEVFLQNVEELMPIMMKKFKKAPEDTNARWHYEKAEKKRAVFYDELLQESKEWKEWRAKKLAEKASENEEDEDEDEDDEGEDIELVRKAEDAREARLPTRPVKKGKLRRHSETESMDSDAPHVTSHRRAATPTRPKQYTSSSNKTVTVEITSPSRKSDKRRQPTSSHTKEIHVDASHDVHMKPASPTLPSAMPESLQHMEGFGSPFEPDLFETIRDKVDRAPTGLEPGGVANSTVTPLSHDPDRGESYSAGGAIASNLEEDSGSEDSRAEVTDDEGQENGDRHLGSHHRVRKNRISDLHEDSFKAEMIAPVARSQEVSQSRRSGPSKEDSIEDFQANPALYELRTSTPGPDASSQHTVNTILSALGEKATPGPGTVSQDYLNKVKNSPGEEAVAPKRHLSTDSDTLSSPVKTDKSHAHKRSRRENTQPSKPYNPKRTILQSPSPAPEDGTSKLLDTAQSRLQTNETSCVPPTNTPTTRPPSSSQSNGLVINISDEEEEPTSEEAQRGPTLPAPFPSQQVKPSKAAYDDSIFNREPLGRIGH